MTDRTLQGMTDEELIELLAELERVQAQAEEALLARLEARRHSGGMYVGRFGQLPTLRLHEKTEPI